MLLLSHAAAGIYSSTLKFSKRVVYAIWGIWVAFQIGMLFFTEYVLTNQNLQFFTGFVLTLIGQYVIFFLTTRGKAVQRLFSILTYSVFFCIAMTFFLMVKGSIGDAYPVLTTCIHFIILLSADCYFLLYVCPLYRTAERNIQTGWMSLVMVNVVFIIAIILTAAFPVRLTSFQNPSAINFVFLTISIIAVYPVIFKSINSMSEAAMKRELEVQNKLLLTQIEAENAQIVSESRSRHDRRHHNLVMLELAKNNDIDSIREYLTHLMRSENEVWGDVRYCQNTTVNTVLTVYERRAVENGIAVDVSATVSSGIEVLPQDLVIVIANLFENAIHATAKMHVEAPRITLTVRESEQRLLIKVENPCKPKMLFNETSYGIGISSVIAVIQKYDGMYDFAAEDGVFSAKAVLNLK